MRILSIGDRVRPGRYTVHARYERSILLFDGKDRPLFVVDRSIGPGPLNLVVGAPQAAVPGETLEIARGCPGPRFDSALPRPDPTRRTRLLRLLQSELPRCAPPDSLASLFDPAATLPPRQQARDRLFHKTFDRFAAGRLAEGVRLIRGCGQGLTPSGDDFLCGWMVACRLHRKSALARTLLEYARSRNPVSNAFLELAAQGRVNAAMKKLLQAPSPARVRDVCAFGHTSGADWLCGLLWGAVSSPDL